MKQRRAHQRLLKRRLAEVSGGAALSDTDWSSIAPLGTDLEVGVERLRFHALQLVSDLRIEDGADDRADQLRGAVGKGRLCETLQLLLVAQQSLYMWQKLRLERVFATEPGFLAQTIDSARVTLQEHLDADQDLANRLRRTLDKHAVLRVSEVHHQLAGRTLSKYRQPLTDMVDKFIEARSLQVEEWLGTQHAGFKDAIAAASTATVQIGRAGRKQLSAGTMRVAKWLEPSEEIPKDETGAEASDAEPDDANR